MKKLVQRHELVLLLLIAVACAVIGWRNPSFFSAGNVYSLLKSSTILGIFAVGALVVLISGNIDISFPAIAAFSMYVTALLARSVDAADHILVVFVIAAGLGCLLGLLNGVLIHAFRLPALIVTLGTASLIRGALLAFIGTRIIANLPDSMIAFSKATLFEGRQPDGEIVGLAASFLLFPAIAVLAHILLRHTLLGRGIHALGGAPEAARRIGFDVRRIQLFVYGFAGVLAGIAGVIHSSTMRNANPFDLAGMELTVIAAVVLGGASITGGRGTVIGAVLGVLLLVIIQNSLLLLGLPSQWHKAVVGVVILVSTGATALRRRGSGLGGVAP